MGGLLRIAILVVALSLSILFGCVGQEKPVPSFPATNNQPSDENSKTSQLPNPASVFCLESGNKYEIRNNTGYCILEDGRECEEWAYYRGECRSATPYEKEADIGEKCGGDSGIKCKNGLECQLMPSSPEGICTKPSEFIKCPDIRPEMCTAIYDPVCGRAGETPSMFEFNTYPNACVACSKTSPALVYIRGTCESLNLTSKAKRADVLYTCPEKRYDKCNGEYDPVCGRIVDATSSLSYFRDFQNPCEACSKQSNAIAYYIGTCDESRTKR